MDEGAASIELLPKRALLRAQGPLYRQLADILREPIANGRFPVGGELPKEASIAEHFGVSLITVRQALRDLETDGLIRKRSAKPAVVAARSPLANLSWNFSNFADMAAFTRDGKLRIKSYKRETSPVLTRHFGLKERESGYCLRSVLTVGPQQKAQITTYFPPDIGAGFRRQDFTDVLIFRSVQKHLGVRLDVAHVTVRAETANDDVADDLEIEPGSAVLVVEMLYQSSDQRNIEFSIARHPANKFAIIYDAPNDLA